MEPYLPSPLESILINSKKRIWIKREDLIHHEVSGNKWRKLEFNILKAWNEKKSILSFGGAFSNHLHALASVCSYYDIPLKCLVRADSIDPKNATLKYILSRRADVKLVSRSDYRKRNNKHYLDEIQALNPQHIIIPEGGSNSLALKGVGKMTAELESQIERIDYLFVPVGSGGTIAGIINGINPKTKVCGISAVNDGSLEEKVRGILDEAKCFNSNWDISFDYTFGGFAKHSPELISFANKFFTTFGFRLDPIYTSKMMFALLDLAQNNAFEKDAKIVAIHTGGLQGIHGFNYLNKGIWL